jgi:D-3-phosphoglycerate dehydrogenase / 2-oxoglutarate reductase
MARPKVLCFWDPTVGEGFLGRLPEVADVEVIAPSEKVLLERLGEFDAYMASLHVRLDRKAIERASRLKVVATSTTGLDHLDMEVLNQRGVKVISIKTEFELLDKITATAELAWGLMLACVRKIPAGAAAANQGRWARDEFRGRMMSGKTLGIIGVGRLGKMVVRYGNAFGMRVLGCDTHDVVVPGVERVSLDRLLAESDVITLHIHLTEANRGFLGRREFEKMKRGVVIINTSRGAIINEGDLLKALESGQVGAAGLDVIEGEWRTDLVDHPLIKYARTHDNVVIVPHVGGITYESQRITAEFTANKLADALKEMGY